MMFRRKKQLGPTPAQKAKFSQFDTPATKLLEKRRMMYEVRENYRAKIKEFNKYPSTISITDFQGGGQVPAGRGGHQSRGSEDPGEADSLLEDPQGEREEDQEKQ